MSTGKEDHVSPNLLLLTMAENNLLKKMWEQVDFESLKSNIDERYDDPCDAHYFMVRRSPDRENYMNFKSLIESMGWMTHEMESVDFVGRVDKATRMEEMMVSSFFMKQYEKIWEQYDEEGKVPKINVYLVAHQFEYAGFLKHINQDPIGQFINTTLLVNMKEANKLLFEYVDKVEDIRNLDVALRAV